MGVHSRLVAALRRRVATRSATPSDDSGFSLIEVIVAIGLIGVVMASLSTFYVGSLATTSAQSGRQGAIQLALDGMEQARSIDSADLLTGRTNLLTNQQWAQAPATVTPYLATMVRGWNDSGTLRLPLAYTPTAAHSVEYTQHWYVGTCYQPTTPDAACDAVQPAGSVPLFRVVVAVTWTDQGCGGTQCSYVNSTLISPATDDPIFNAHSTPSPTLTAPADQSHVQGSTVTLPVVGAGGAPPLLWLLSGQPAGLSINPTTGVISGTVTTIGSSPIVTVTLRDSLSRDDSVTFSWTVTAPAAPALASAGPWTNTAGTAITTGRSVAVTGGAHPLTWSASNLPSGLAINRNTGDITGTPSAAGTYTNVLVRVTDNLGRSASRTVAWTINPAPQPPAPARPSDQTWTYNGTVSVGTPAVTGGTAPFTWAASGLPNGVTIDDETGRLTGRANQLVFSSRTATITVTDSLGKKGSTTFTWRITLGGSNGGPGE